MDDIFPPAKTTQVEGARIYILIFTDAQMSMYGGGVTTMPALLLAAGAVGIGHAVMPDHWLPLAVLARTRRYRPARVLRLSLAAALAHVAVSLALGGLLVVIGLQFRATVARHTDLVVGGILLVTGAVFLVLELRGDRHGHRHSGQGRERHDHEAHDDHGDHGRAHNHGREGHDHGGREVENVRGVTAVLERPASVPRQRTARRLAGLLIPFGAAASPDLTILPVFLAAAALGTPAALGSLAAFTAATVATIVALTTATTLGARLLTASWIDRRAGLITALTLLVIGALVATGRI